jgi:radical SAM superfamily enzyme YgiQ (UPF0313 family)
VNDTGKTIEETITFAKDLNPRKVQFSILTPYPGTKLYERVKERLLTKDWGEFTALTPIIELDDLSPGQLNRRLIKAYASFYLRPRKGAENIRHISRTIPGLTKWFASWFGPKFVELTRILQFYRRIFTSGKQF